MKAIPTDVVVIGAGPGGYAAAFHAADFGKKVILVEQDKRPGGVCLNYGCIPSKALLHATQMIRESKHSADWGVSFTQPKVSLDKMRAWKEGILNRLSGGITQLGEGRGVQFLYGRGYFEDSQTLRVETASGQKFVKFDKAVVAVGSKPALPKNFDLGNKRIMTSTEALEIEEIPQNLLIVGGGYIGLELGTVYASLGSRIVLVEALPSLLPGVDPDLILPVMKYAKENFKEVRLGAKVLKMATSGKQIKVSFEIGGKEKAEHYDRVLVAVGRTPHCVDLGLENTKAQRDDRGFVVVNKSMQTDDPSIYAIGDVVGGMMLAHKAAREARIAAESLSGEEVVFENVIPAVVYTDPEIAWCGLTETEAKQKGLAVKTVRFPWAALGRAMTLGRTEGMTKLILEEETERILGVGIVGYGAGDLISEGVLAIEMGATARDLAEMIHPHPTLSETYKECAEKFYGFSVHSLPSRRLAAP